MKKRLALYTLLLTVTFILLTSCGKSAEKSTESTTEKSGTPVEASTDTKTMTSVGNNSVSQQKDIIAAISLDFTTMDPMDTSDTLSGGIQRMIMDGLFGFDDDMNIYPMLATGYQANDVATEYTISLRKGISFTDGAPWNADAALANFTKWADKSLGLKRTTFLSGVLKKCEKVDDYTIKVTLNEPFGAFISNLAHPACLIMSPKQIAAGQEACAYSPVGTGQYSFVEWVQGDHLTLKLNEKWWGYDSSLTGGPSLADKDAGCRTVTFKPVGEGSTRVAMLMSNDAQIIWPVPTESMNVLKANSNVSVFQAEGIVVRYFMMNNQKAPFNDLRVRQAINYAIDKNAYIQVVKNGLGSVATSIIGPAVQYYKRNEPVPYDKEKAKQLLAEAGYPNGFSPTLMYASTSANQKQAEFFKQQLATVGINLKLNGMESAILNQKVQGAKGPGSQVEVEIYLSGWSPSTGDADWGIRPLLAIESEPPKSYNMCYFENEKLEGYIKAGLQSADDTIRREAYTNAQNLIWEEVPMVILANDYNTWATGKDITGVKIYPDGAINMKNAKISK
ncbi:MAG: ABC transporter substrate-binding protein [Sphaerochaetaceae bacterium]